MNIPEILSEREKEVAALLLQGKSNKQIAQELGISTRTAEFHVTHIYEKLGVTSRAEAIVRLSEPQLRESTGTAGAQPSVELRQPTVEKKPDVSENKENQNLTLRRYPLKKILLIAVAFFAIPCLAIGLIWAGGLAFFLDKPLTKAGEAPAATYTPWQPTYTPWEPTRTPYLETPAPSGNPPPTRTPITDFVVQKLEDGRVRFEGVTFMPEPALGVNLRGEVMPENPASENSPYWEIYPQYIRLFLDDYPVKDSIWKPVIAVYPVEEYRRLSPPAAETLNKLQTLLAEKPADPGIGEEANVLPFLPPINSAQSYRSNVKYLDFENGAGVRYLAVYGQYPVPVNNQELFYTFQGLTSDGRHVISIVMPVNHPALPANVDALSFATQESIFSNYGEHRAEMYAALNNQPDNTFTPDLSKLDALVASLWIDR